jgi:flagellar hook-associated protein 3 FlgL
MRVSTTQIFRNGIDSIQQNQVELSRTQQQLASGRRILSPSDDPAGAVQALQLRSSVDKVEQYQRNADMLTQRLQLSETTVGSVVSGLQRVRELALQGNDATQTAESRRYIAGEIRQALGELQQLANSKDANGEYIFAGLSSFTQPFVAGAGGQVEFQGDQGQRSLQISAVRQVPVGDSGFDVFMSVPNGNGTFFVQDDPGNSGTGVIDAGSLVDAGAWIPDTYTIEFGENSAGERIYQIVGAVTGNVLPASGDVDDAPVYRSGEAISFNGIQTSIQGVPEAGDRFVVEPSARRDLFGIYGGLADALEAPVTNGAAQARLNNAVNRALVDLDQGLGRLLDTQASLGARLNTVDTQRNINESQILQLRTNISGIEDLDYAEAISRFNLQQAALQAAQQTYVQVQRLTLFNFL